MTEIEVFSWEIYLIVVISYLFGFMAGYAKSWILIASLLFLAYPFYYKWKLDRNKLNSSKEKQND